MHRLQSFAALVRTMRAANSIYPTSESESAVDTALAELSSQPQADLAKRLAEAIREYEASASGAADSIEASIRYMGAQDDLAVALSEYDKSTEAAQ